MSFSIRVAEVFSLLQARDLILSAHCMQANTESLSGIHTDSRQITRDNIFICISGYQTDGHKYIKNALANGAKLIIGEEAIDADFDYIRVTNSRLASALICKKLYGIDEQKIKLVGITGTNGKTTVAWLMHQLSRKAGINSGFIGTIGCFYGDIYEDTKLTTPDIVDINRLILKMQNAGVEIVFIEASSHALALDRLSAFEFALAMFLNLSQDHLDFHKNMDAYADSKLKLFEHLGNNGKALINIDSYWGQKIWQNVNSDKLSISQCEEADIIFNINKIDLPISDFTLTYNEMDLRFSTQLTGGYNMLNLSMALCGMHLIYPQLSLQYFQQYTPSLLPAPGRLERVENPEKKNIYKDYAHTPDALLNVCKAAKDFTSGRLICIIGAGGNRDKGKRPKMLSSALKFSDLVIVTTDNPRHEKPLEIIEDMLGDCPQDAPLWIKVDRRKAIWDAILISSNADTILITGKGHEDYQIVGDKKIPFDENEIVNEYFRLPQQHVLHWDRAMLEFACNGSISHLENISIKSIITDTRKLTANSLFVPLQGTNYDGHDYIDTALKISGNLALAGINSGIDNDRIIKVDDTLLAYGRIARTYRMLMQAKIIGITGSAGKTSIKELLFNILSISGKTHKTTANENNLVGVPKTILEMMPDDIYSVVELGTNHFGEINRSAYILKPDIAVIANIGASHLEFLIDENGVFKEKRAIFDHGAAYKLYPGNDKRFAKIDGLSFGNTPECCFYLSDIQDCDGYYKFMVNKEQYQIEARAIFQVTNALIAIAAAQLAGLNRAQIQQGLAKRATVPLRMEILNIGRRIIIADCYNANPQSTAGAIQCWQKMHPERPHVAILGSMLELGVHSRSKHNEIGKAVKDQQPELFAAVGDEALEYDAEQHFASVEKLIESGILEKAAENAVILIKGSHGIHLERLLKRYSPKGIW